MQCRLDYMLLLLLLQPFSSVDRCTRGFQDLALVARNLTDSQGTHNFEFCQACL